MQGRTILRDARRRRNPAAAAAHKARIIGCGPNGAMNEARRRQSNQPLEKEEKVYQ
jgi:hypothetical protein